MLRDARHQAILCRCGFSTKIIARRIDDALCVASDRRSTRACLASSAERRIREFPCAVSSATIWPSRKK